MKKINEKKIEESLEKREARDFEAAEIRELTFEIFSNRYGRNIKNRKAQ